MVKVAAAFLALPFASGFGLTWSDCGDADTHAKVADLQPATVGLGKNSLKGTGTVDMDIDGGSFNFVTKSGPIPVLKGTGDLCQDTTIDMPGGIGTVVFHSIGCPHQAGDLEVDLDVNLLTVEDINNLLNIHITAETATGDKLLCLDIGVTAAQDVSASRDHRPVPEFEISLDDAPEERFAEVLTHFAPQLQDFMTYFHADSSIVKTIATAVALKRGRETDELQRELNGYAKYTGITKHELHLINLLMELTTLMVPIVNFTHGSSDMNLIQELLGEELPQNLRVPFPETGACMGIVATSDEDGTVYHARNLDLPFAKILQPMMYTGIFTKGGSEIFRAQMVAGYDAVLTGMRKGPNGYAFEINTRFPDHVGGNSDMIKRVFTDHVVTSGFSKRKILETIDNYEDAVDALSTTPYAASEYNVVSGVKKGTVLARNPDGLAYQLPLSESEKKYIIMTNFDYTWGDIREQFDPTGGSFGSRRKAAEAVLDNADSITADLLFKAINDHGAMAGDTQFQVIMDVETGLWNASLPACTKCPTPTVVV